MVNNSSYVKDMKKIMHEICLGEGSCAMQNMAARAEPNSPRRYLRSIKVPQVDAERNQEYIDKRMYIGRRLHAPVEANLKALIRACLLHFEVVQARDIIQNSPKNIEQNHRRLHMLAMLDMLEGKLDDRKEFFVDELHVAMRNLNYFIYGVDNTSMLDFAQVCDSVIEETWIKNYDSFAFRASVKNSHERKSVDELKKFICDQFDYEVSNLSLNKATEMKKIRLEMELLDLRVENMTGAAISAYFTGNGKPEHYCYYTEDECNEQNLPKIDQVTVEPMNENDYKTQLDQLRARYQYLSGD